MPDPMWKFLRVLCDYLFLDLVELDITMPSAMSQAFPDNSFDENVLLLKRLTARAPDAWNQVMPLVDDPGLRSVLQDLRVFKRPAWELVSAGPFDHFKNFGSSPVRAEFERDPTPLEHRGPGHNPHKRGGPFPPDKHKRY